MSRIELTYGKTLRTIMNISNPVKKMILKTECVTHKFINSNAINILNNESYYNISIFMKKYISDINNGSVWADTDYKSINHFYSIDTLKGLYGFSNLLKEFTKYYRTAIYYLEKKCLSKSMFYLGVCLHLLQDSNVPQHGSVNLLKEHRQFELWIISRLYNEEAFKTSRGILRFDKLEDYIVENVRFSQNVARENKFVYDKDERYMNISIPIIKRATQASAGFLIDFYEKIVSENLDTI